MSETSLRTLVRELIEKARYQDWNQEKGIPEFSWDLEHLLDDFIEEFKDLRKQEQNQ